MKKHTLIWLSISIFFSISVAESRSTAKQTVPLGTGLCNFGVNRLYGETLIQCEDWLKDIDMKLKNGISDQLRTKLSGSEISCWFYLDSGGNPKNIHIVGDAESDEGKALLNLVNRSGPYPVAPLKLWTNTAITIQISNSPEIQFVRLAKISANFMKTTTK